MRTMSVDQLNVSPQRTGACGQASPVGWRIYRSANLKEGKDAHYQEETLLCVVHNASGAN